MKQALVIFVCALAPIAILLARMNVEGRAALHEAKSATGERRVQLLGRAARRLGGPAGEARDKLAVLGRQGDAAAWQELRGAILATRSLFTPDQALLDEANLAIADRIARELTARTSTAPDAERALQLARLQISDEPSRVMSIVSLTGLFLFLAGVAALAWAGRSRARLLATVAGFAALVMGLWRA